MSSKKRESPSRHLPFPKRRRPLPAPAPAPSSSDHPPSSPPATVLVIGLPTNSSVLDLKSRFEIYGPISRTRIDPHGVGFVTFRSISSADSAVSASLDPSFGISFSDHRVQVVLAGDSKGGTGVDGEHMRHNSKLVKASPPLSKHGRGNRLSSAIVAASNNGGGSSSGNDVGGDSRLDVVVPFKGRELVAYDDL